MNYKDYNKEARQFLSPAIRDSKLKLPGLGEYNALRVIHAALGLATEALELQEGIRKGVDAIKLHAELGDIVWFASDLMDEFGIDPAEYAYLMHSPEDQTVENLLHYCEEMASRVKAAIAYGTPVKPDDGKDANRWQKFAFAAYFAAIGVCQRNNLPCPREANLKKLRARNQGKTFNVEATINRDPEAEFRAIENG